MHSLARQLPPVDGSPHGESNGLLQSLTPRRDRGLDTPNASMPISLGVAM
jgi:hypothetical protein